jgi:hypothetical protein
MSPKTEHTSVVSEHLPAAQLSVQEPSASHQLVPVNHSVSLAEVSNLAAQLSALTVRSGRPRLGKIARLPKQYRDMVCRMLRNNCSAPKIVDALHDLGINVTERNISNWKTCGGYREWCLEEDRAAEIRAQQDNLLHYLRKEQASQIPEVGLQIAAHQLSRFLLQPEAIQQLVANPEDYARLVGTLCRVADKIHSLQKYRDECSQSLGWKHNPEKVRRQNEQEIERVRECYSSTPPLSAKEDPIPYRNFMPTAGLSEHPVEPARDSEPASFKSQLEMLRRVAEAAKQKQYKQADAAGAKPPPTGQK